MAASNDTAPDPFLSLLDRDDVAAFLQVKPRLLAFYAYGLAENRRYRRIELKKRSGGIRTISAPIAPLKDAQAKIAKALSARYSPRSCVFGYVNGRNIQDNARCHVGKKWVLRVDLKDFFPSINFGRVYGLLRAAPFSLPPRVASLLAQLCCDENKLPQGSPASPMISNLICRGLDHALSKLARQHRCSYTRYCDDLVFSTNRRTFPAAIAVLEGESAPKAAAGTALVHEIERAGFKINEEKTSLRSQSQRQMVTGLVTNQRVNVPRKYVRDLRMILHVWESHGHDEASRWFFEKHDRRNRPPKIPPPPFNWIVRGKLQHIGAVRGWDDEVYRKLADRLAKLDSSFKPVSRSQLTNPPLHVYVEGKTDKAHIEMALADMQRQGKFADLRLKIDEKDRGSDELLKLCRGFAERQQTAPCVFLFDSDELKIVPQVTDSNGDAKDWGNHVYSLCIATPPHRQGERRLCIELLFFDVDLQRPDDAGRRVFLASEFVHPSSRHRDMQAYSVNPNKSSLVVDDGVFDFEGNKICLSKVGFTQVIRRQSVGVVNFEGFVPLFEQLVALRTRILDGGWKG